MDRQGRLQVAREPATAEHFAMGVSEHDDADWVMKLQILKCGFLTDIAGRNIVLTTCGTMLLLHVSHSAVSQCSW